MLAAMPQGQQGQQSINRLLYGQKICEQLKKVFILRDAANLFVLNFWHFYAEIVAFILITDNLKKFMRSNRRKFAQTKY